MLWKLIQFHTKQQNKILLDLEKSRVSTPDKNIIKVPKLKPLFLPRTTQAMKHRISTPLSTMIGA